MIISNLIIDQHKKNQSSEIWTALPIPCELFTAAGSCLSWILVSLGMVFNLHAEVPFVLIMSLCTISWLQANFCIPFCTCHPQNFLLLEDILDSFIILIRRSFEFNCCFVLSQHYHLVLTTCYIDHAAPLQSSGYRGGLWPRALIHYLLH